MKDIIIGCIINYTPDKIKNWVESINSSGFEGDKLVISYGVPKDTIDYLSNSGFIVLESSLEKGQFIHNRRFLDMWYYLNSSETEYRYVISTDVRDVIFQYSPSRWIDRNLNKSILCGSENILIKNQSWNVKNISLNYPHLYEMTKNNEVCNVGVIAGRYNEFKDFCIHLYHFIITKTDEEYYADQAALNCFISMKHMDTVIQIANQNSLWCAHLGVTLNPDVSYESDNMLLENVPIINELGQVLSSEGKQFCVVHQYDRVPELNDLINERYK